MNASPKPVHRFSHDAMATTLEVVIRGQMKDYARQVARASFEEADRLEGELSRFIGASDVSQINRLTAGQSVRVGIALIECLHLARQVHEETHGAFDVTLGSLLACWRTEDGSPHTPAADEVVAARARTGMDRVEWNEAEHSVAVLTDGVKIDLGGIGKGYAVDQMAALLRDWGIEDALLHAGESTALAIGSWPVAIRDPQDQTSILGQFPLRDRALSGSGVSLHGPHILDPRTGRPATGKLATWAAAPTAALSDALATAFMVMSPREVEAYCTRHRDVSALLLVGDCARREMVRLNLNDLA
jgi:thiamine biosynthesis lipoprotein